MDEKLRATTSMISGGADRRWKSEDLYAEALSYG
jgi:hypothetical protein